MIDPVEFGKAMGAIVREAVAPLQARIDQLEKALAEQVMPLAADIVAGIDLGAVAKAAAQLGYSHMNAVSGAGHDAVYMARLAPAGMIFIPCKDGISHNEIEDAKPEHIEAGCNVLLHAMLERAG